MLGSMVCSGIVTEHGDATVRPQDDLFIHVNGSWLAHHEIPPDRATDGAFRELRDEAEDQVRAIIEAADGQAPGDDPVAHEERLMAALYASFMDVDRIGLLGVSPLQEDFAQLVDLVDSPSLAVDLARAMGRLERVGVSGVFDAWVDTDPAEPTRYTINLSQGGLGLPDEAYYREDQHSAIRDRYVAHIERMFSLLERAGQTTVGRLRSNQPLTATFGLSPAEAAQQVFELEKKLAQAHWDVVKDRDDSLTHNPSSLAELILQAPGFPWQAWAEGLAMPEGALDHVVVREPSFFDRLGQLWPTVPLDDWRRWLAWHILHSRAPFLPREFVEENFAFYGRALQGTQTLRQRWKRGVGFVEGSVGEAVGRRYVERHFPPEHKARMLVLVRHLLEAYRQSIRQLTWLGEETKAKALLKLDQFTPKIGYPDRWRDYSALAASPFDLVGNVRTVSAWETDRELAKLGGPVDRDEWFMTPQTVNAYYNAGLNEIVFPAAILQPPFFTAEADDAVNYGGIGAIIGHEIGHGFDDQGSKHDGTGALVDWWTAEDRQRFEERTQALIAQYDAFTVDLPDGPRSVNGALTIGENIGDLGGLAIAWQAYVIALDGATPPVIDGLSAAERFFFGWAQGWRAKTRPEEQALRLATDPHSPDQFRCNGTVRNLELFHQTFDVQPGDAMWLPPDERVTIW